MLIIILICINKENADNNNSRKLNRTELNDVVEKIFKNNFFNMSHTGTKGMIKMYCEFINLY